MIEKGAIGMADYEFQKVESDVLVIGSGLAGSMAAISCLQEGCKVTVVNKGKLCWSGSTATCGGNDIAVCFPEDDRDMWIQAFVESSDYTVNQRWLQIFLDESHEQLKKLEMLGRKYGCEVFPKKDDGSYWLIHRAINPFKTVICDIYGALHTFEKTFQESSAHLFERVMITNLLMEEEQVVGAVGFHCRTGKRYVFLAKTVILAAGCCTYKADVFDVCGEGYKMAYDVGAKMLSFDRGGAIMRPRNVMRGGVLCNSGSSSMANALGSKMVNRNGIDLKECMTEDERKLGRAGQDIAIQREIKNGNGPICEDFVHLPIEVKNLIKKLRIASVKRVQAEYGKDPFEELIPIGDTEQTITPDQSNRMGGVWIDETGETSVKGLFAVGDSSCPTLSFQHPYNGSDLGWALLSGGRVGRFVAKVCQNMKITDDFREQASLHAKEIFQKYEGLLEKESGIHPDTVKTHLLETLIPYDVNHRDEQALTFCLEKIENIIETEIPNMKAEDVRDLRKAIEADSMAQVAKMILASERYRKESRVGVRRRDYPLMDNDHWKKWIGIQKIGDKMNLFTEDIPEILMNIPAGTVRPLTNRF